MQEEWSKRHLVAEVNASSSERAAPGAEGGGTYSHLRPSRRALTKVEASYLDIRQAILEGRLAPGARIDQDELGRILGCSITPIREALRWLASEDLVQVSAHREVIVSRLSGKELTDLYNVRLLLDPFAASLGARNAGPEARQKVMELAAAPCPETQHERMAQNRAFHQSIYEASGNNVLVSQLDSLWDRTGRYRLTVLDTSDRARDARDEHMEIAQAFNSGLYETIARLMHDHIATSFDRILHEVSLQGHGTLNGAHESELGLD
jgi:DNA-binding GntR family transcriptional regulator